MKKNMGKVDIIVRIALAIVFSILYFTGIVSGTIGVLLLVFGGIFLVTSVLNFCPLYIIFGINTCKK